MTGVGHAKPVSHGAARGANSPPLPNFCKDCDRKVRFGDRSRSAGGGGSGSTATVKQLKDSKAADKPKPSRPPDAVAHKEKQAGELPTFGEMKAQEFRLRGKLKWLFEQDRMFWETNSAKSSRRSSFEVDRMPALNAVPITSTTAKPAVDSPDDAKLVHVVEESFKRVSSSKKPANEMKPPKQAPPTDKAMVSSKGEGLATFTDRHTISSLAKIPWTFTNGTAKFWPRGKSKALPNSSAPPNAEFKARPPVPKPSCVDPMAKRVKASESATLMSREEILSDHDDAPKSGESSEMRSSDDEDEAVSKKVNEIIDRGGDRSLQDVKNQAACLKVKCNMLAKEKDHTLRKWKKSCQEIDDAAKMAQALRTAIQTLLEASASDSRADFKARQDILEDQTQALKVRMENLRRKNSEGLQRQSKEKPPSAHLEDRMETLRKSSESRSLGSPEIPRDAEYKVEALRARLEKLMLATNSLVVDEERQPEKGSGEQNTLVEDWLQRQKSEKSELKMKSWLNSLSAELASEESLDTPRAICEKSNGTSGCLTPYTSKQRMPSTVKQESPWSSTHDRDAPGSAPSSVETKKNVIHKIAEEVQYEAKQWFQVQELLGRVGDDMKSLQEACSTWERRAILAEAQVVHMQQEGHGLKEKTLQLGDVKIAELQKEMLRLRETVDDVKKQVGNINIDPSRWFEAAQNFGYAFMPVNLHLPDGASCGCKSKCDHSSCEKGTPDSRDQWRQRIYATATVTSQPSCSGSTAPTFSIISSSEKTPDSEWRLRSQLPSQQWAKEIAKAEEDEILTTANTTGQVPKLEFPNDSISSASGGKSQERSAKPSHKELGLDSSDSTGEMLLQRQTSTKDTFGVVQQEEQPSRYSNFPTSRRSRSPLRDVLENITSSKENKRPY